MRISPTRRNILTLVIGMMLLVMGCKERKLVPGETAFETANTHLDQHSTGSAFGNTPEATKLARQFAAAAPTVRRHFEGDDSAWDESATDGEYLTHVHVTDSAIVLLVRVPSLKRYKGAARDRLMQLLWAHVGPAVGPVATGKKVILAVRGAIFYGGTAVGDPAGKPIVNTAGLVSTDFIYPHFAALDRTAKAPGG